MRFTVLSSLVARRSSLVARRSSLVARPERIALFLLAVNLFVALFCIAPAANAQITSNFDTNGESWSVVSLNNLPNNDYGTFAGPYNPNYNATGGNPTGYISITDPDGGWFLFSAPTKFLGNQSDKVGGKLTYDLLHTGGVDYFTTDVIFLSDSTRLLWRASPDLSPVDNVWTSVSLTLTPSANWLFNTTNGSLATAGNFQTVFSNLKGIYIRGEYKNGDETAGLDNVRLTSSAAPEASPFALLALGGLVSGIVAVRRRMAGTA